MKLLQHLLHALFRSSTAAGVEARLRQPIPVWELVGPLTRDCAYRGPGVYYLYLEGESAPVYVGKSKDVRHRLRWHRYHLQEGDYPENPAIDKMRWVVGRFDTEPEAWRFEQSEIGRLKPRWNGTGMSRRAIKARRAA